MKCFFVFFLILGFLVSPTYATEKVIKGKYEIIGPINALKGADQIEMIEFFNYSCGHCYRFLQTNKRLHEKYKNKLQHIKYPIYWGNQTPYPARAFYITDKLGLENKFTRELFDTNFKLNINIFQSKVVNFLATDYGILKEMTEGMKSKQIEDKVKKGLALAKHFEANETPTLIINKTLKVTPSIGGGGDVDKMTENLENIFDSILNFK